LSKRRRAAVRQSGGRVPQATGTGVCAKRTPKAAQAVRRAVGIPDRRSRAAGIGLPAGYRRSAEEPVRCGEAVRWGGTPLGGYADLKVVPSGFPTARRLAYAFGTLCAYPEGG
jgi:hypothetical protein